MRAEKATEVEVLKQENELLRAAIAAADEVAKTAVDALQVLHPYHNTPFEQGSTGRAGKHMQAGR